MARYLDVTAIDDIALGASVLGTGGGGDPHLGSLMAKQVLRQRGPVQILTLEDVADNALLVPSSVIGAPTVALEKIMSTRQIISAFEMMEKTLGASAAATFPIEVGGFNSLIPIVVAAYKNIPMVDCDAMGRAFPESQMVTFFLDGLPSAPNTLADEKGNVVVLHPLDGIWSERFARDITTQMGASAAMCDYPMRGRQLKQSAIGGTLTLAESIGRTLRLANHSGSSALQALLEVVQGYAVACGKVTDVERLTRGGFARGRLRLEGLAEHKGERFTILFQNEFLLAHRETGEHRPSQDNLLAVTPDLISILDHESGRPITTEQLRYGQRVDVIAFPCHHKWRTPKGIEVAGPGYFGYPVAFVPIEQLMLNKGA